MCYSPLVQICRYFIRSCAELIWHYLFKERASLVAQMVKNLPAMQETWVQSLGQEKPPEKGMATHSNILAWGIPWTEEPDGLQSMGLQRIGHNWVTELNWTELLWNKNFLKTSYSNWPSLPQNRNDLEFLYFLWQHIYLHDGCVLISYSHVPLFVNLWTVAHQAPLFMEFSRQEYWSRLSFPYPGNLPNAGT